jgi:hypothetical protein
MIPKSTIHNSPLAKAVVFTTAAGPVKTKALFESTSSMETADKYRFNLDNPVLTCITNDVLLVKEDDPVEVEGEEEAFKVRSMGRTTAGVRYFELVYK